ncbi:hypothetical protein AQUCO_00300793v1 [Aquilegia coerulea]|uniref:Uncharacterized protein n=1 Tax=Aquilegia coerulea TaxID=218851 RepID=A0A2G5F0M1_AQUCA|nr:hypothetical protein AQUCO_00300793v1 [Aquilegia coerulea]
MTFYFYEESITLKSKLFHPPAKYNLNTLNYTIDCSLTTRSDLYINGDVEVHGIGSLINYPIYGGGVSCSVSAVVVGEVVVVAIIMMRACSCIEFPVSLSVALAILGFKIVFWIFIFFSSAMQCNQGN